MTVEKQKTTNINRMVYPSFKTLAQIFLFKKQEVYYSFEHILSPCSYMQHFLLIPEEERGIMYRDIDLFYGGFKQQGPLGKWIFVPDSYDEEGSLPIKLPDRKDWLRVVV